MNLGDLGALILMAFDFDDLRVFTFDDL